MRAVEAALRDEPGLAADRRRRAEVCLRRAERARTAAIQAPVERAEERSRRAWRWLVQAERFLAEARG